MRIRDGEDWVETGPLTPLQEWAATNIGNQYALMSDQNIVWTFRNSPGVLPPDLIGAYVGARGANVPADYITMDVYGGTGQSTGNAQLDAAITQQGIKGADGKYYFSPEVAQNLQSQVINYWNGLSADPISPALAIGLPVAGIAAGAIAAGAGVGAAGGAAGGALPESYWSALADAGGAGTPSAAAGTVGAGAFPSTAAEIAAANEAAAAGIGEGVATGTSGALEAGAGGAGGAGGGLADLLSTPTPPTGVFGGGGGGTTAQDIIAAGDPGSPVGNVNTGVGTDPLSGGFQTVNPPAGVTIPNQSGFNLLDPSTYGGTGAAASTAGTALSRILNGTGTTADYASLLGTGLQTGLGIYAGNQQAGALRDVANQQRTDRLPALTAFNTALSNPDTFYNSAPAMGGLDAVLRKLSVNGNPAMDPGALSKAAAYNLGGYNDYLRALSGPAFGTSNSEANINVGAAGAQGGAWEAGGAGLQQLLNPSQQYRLNIGNFLA